MILKKRATKNSVQPKDPPGTLSGSFGRKWKRDPTAKTGDEGVITTPKGETYSPLVKRTNQPLIKTRQEFEEKFGGLTKNYYLPYAVQEYLGSASTCTIVRVMNTGGFP